MRPCLHWKGECDKDVTWGEVGHLTTVAWTSVTVLSHVGSAASVDPTPSSLGQRSFASCRPSKYQKFMPFSKNGKQSKLTQLPSSCNSLPCYISLWAGFSILSCQQSMNKMWESVFHVYMCEYANICRLLSPQIKHHLYITICKIQAWISVRVDLETIK